MAISRNASAVSFGMEFQMNAAIVLFLENIRNLKTLRIEGKSEDVEILLENNKYIFVQAKAAVHGNTDFTNAMKKFSDALESLHDASTTGKPFERTIYVTNILDPLHHKTSFNLFSHEVMRCLGYRDLSKDLRDKIRKCARELKRKLNFYRFRIYVIPYAGDRTSSGRYCYIINAITAFLRKCGLTPGGLDEELRKVWAEELLGNSSEDCSERVLTKRDLLWPVIIIATSEDFFELNNAETFCETRRWKNVARHYATTLKNRSEEFEFISKISGRYCKFNFDGSSHKKRLQFIEEVYRDYIAEFAIEGITQEEQEILTKATIYVVLDQNEKINRICKGANLCDLNQF